MKNIAIKLTITFVLCLLLQAKFAGAQSTLIPRPVSYMAKPGNFTVTAQTRIISRAGNKETRAIAGMLAAELQSRTGKKIAVKTAPAAEKNAIFLELNSKADTLGDEGYTLLSGSGGVTIRANRANGLFYGMQTLLQLLPPGGGQNIPAVQIADKPRFGWRGSMLDVGRYFYSIGFLKKYLDYMAMHKLNVFHWHLTEDHGWRLEIKKYPRLTEVGAWRKGTQYGKSANQVDRNPHGGFYTQEEARDLVAYAAQRYITVVPEIEMPGHALAALAAYPQLSCTGGPFKMPVAWGIQKDVFCAGNEETFAFLEDVLTEVAAIFPSPIIHIGGDECPKDRWKACPKCQAVIKKNNLKDEHELQSYFIRRIENFLATKNRRIIGWDEILEGGLAPNATVMSWRGIAGGIAAAKEHHDVVMAPTDYMYFDYYQGEPQLEPVAIGGMLPLQKVYNYEPFPKELSAAETKYIKGVQGNVWAEHIHSPGKVEYMAFPRLAALAELSWTPASLKNWDDFTRRMVTQYKRYERMNINYAKSAMNVTYEVTPKGDTLAEVLLKTDSYKPDIRYTTDGSEPTASSEKYIQKPVTVKLPGTIKAAVFENGKPVGAISGRSVLKAGQTN